MTEILKVEVEVVINDNDQTKILVHQTSNQDLSADMIAMVLASGLALAIRLSENDVETMKDVIDYLHGEFIDTESFKDARIVKS